MLVPWVKPPTEFFYARTRPYLAEHGSKQRADSYFSDAGVTQVVFDLTEIHTVIDWFEHMRASLPYPGWAGGGWDSLNDVFEEIADSWPFPLVFSFVGIASPSGEQLRLLLQLVLTMGRLEDDLATMGKQLIPVFYEASA
ncbi:MAG: hypothetical protein JWQ12_2346 [Glaciihabitans sp.]|nr:hypothetical protein [Glaciihabitans sp.]